VIVNETVFDPEVLYVTVWGPIPKIVAGVAPDPKFQLYIVPPVVPVDVLVNVTEEPTHIDRGVPEKLALSPHPWRLIASVLGVPLHPAVFLSVTDTLPFVVPKFTVMLFVPCPVATVAPGGTVHV
jgi:hypothetical protein